MFIYYHCMWQNAMYPNQITKLGASTKSRNYVTEQEIIFIVLQYEKKHTFLNWLLI